MKPALLRAMWVEVMVRLASVLVMIGAIGCDASTEQRPAPAQATNNGEPDPNANNDALRPQFVSADPSAEGTLGGNGGGGGTNNGTADSYTIDDDLDEVFAPSVALSSDLLLTADTYAGLQVINLTDPDHPEVQGRMDLTGEPQALVVVGDYALVGLASWHSWYAGPLDAANTLVHGSAVMAVDLRDPAAPRLVDPLQLETGTGVVQVTHTGAGDVLTVASCDRACTLRNLSLDGAGRMVEVGRIDLGPDLAFLAVGQGGLVVARDRPGLESPAAVAVVTFAPEDGQPSLSADVEVEGLLVWPRQVDLWGHILRVVSVRVEGGIASAALETFDVSDPGEPARMDVVTFATGESVRSIRFEGRPVLVGTDARPEGLHTLHMDASGHAAEVAHSLQNRTAEGLRAVVDDTRLLSIRSVSTDGRALVVELHDLDDLGAPAAMIDRATVQWPWPARRVPWSERFFTVLEGAVSVQSASGEVETGLLLVPYTGVDGEREVGVAGSQVFTFSARSITARGMIPHAGVVRESLVWSGERLVQVSGRELRSAGKRDLDDVVTGRGVDLAPSCGGIFAFGEYAARVMLPQRVPVEYERELQAAGKQVELVPLGSEPREVALASFGVGRNARLIQHGALLLSLEATVIAGGPGAHTYHTDLDVVDLSEPLSPHVIGSLSTDALHFDESGWTGSSESDDAGEVEAHSVGHALVFPSRWREQRAIGAAELCTITSTEPPTEESHVEGAITCTRVDGGPRECEGALSLCHGPTGDGEGSAEVTCEDVDPALVATTETCTSVARNRRWDRFELDVLDLTDPAHPTASAHLELPADEEAVRVVAEGDKLHVSTRRPVEREDDPRPHVRHAVTTIDLAEPASPRVSEAVNVPGELLASAGEVLHTLELLWGAAGLEGFVRRVRAVEGVVSVEASFALGDQPVIKALSDAGRLYVVQGVPYGEAALDPDFDWTRWHQRLTILSAELEPLAQLELPTGTQVLDVRGGLVTLRRAVSGGVLVVNVTDPAAPFTQAYFAAEDQPVPTLLTADALFLAAGRYGLYRLPLEGSNLLQR